MKDQCRNGVFVSLPFGQHQPQRVERIVRLELRSASQRLVQNRAQGVDIGRFRDQFRAA